jgi:hypothetical protein
MARLSKSQTSLDSLFFSTPEQKLIRLLLNHPQTSFTPRVICSKLKGVRGLGGAEGVTQILEDFKKLGLVDFISNDRAVRIQDDNPLVRKLQVFATICNFESLTETLRPISNRGILFENKNARVGSLEEGYDLFVVSDNPEEVKKAAGRHPLGRSIELIAWTPELYSEIQTQDQGLFLKISNGIVLWNNY